MLRAMGFGIDRRRTFGGRRWWTCMTDTVTFCSLRSRRSERCGYIDHVKKFNAIETMTDQSLSRLGLFLGPMLVAAMRRTLREACCARHIDEFETSGLWCGSPRSHMDDGSFGSFPPRDTRFGPAIWLDTRSPLRTYLREVTDSL